MNYSFAKALTGLAFSVCSMSALAAPIDATQSEVKATFKQFNVPVSGNFKKFTGDVQYDPAKPADTKATLSVDTASYDLGDPEYNKEVAGKDWFDSKNHPQATFVITGVTGTGNNLQATGDLTIRGIKKPLKFPVKIQTLAGKHTFTGKTQIKRLEYKVGADGEWGDTSLVADEVVIDFKLVMPAK
ncbi:MAG: YceI family protein [Gammaproteobacteria bacterium]|nr:YceI family protein [Gammaproteobacteria bacterium]